MRKVVVLGIMVREYIIWIKAVSSYNSILFCMEKLEKNCFARQEGQERKE